MALILSTGPLTPPKAPSGLVLTSNGAGVLIRSHRRHKPRTGKYHPLGQSPIAYLPTVECARYAQRLIGEWWKAEAWPGGYTLFNNLAAAHAVKTYRGPTRILNGHQFFTWYQTKALQAFGFLPANMAPPFTWGNGPDREGTTPFPCYPSLPWTPPTGFSFNEVDPVSPWLILVSCNYAANSPNQIATAALNPKARPGISRAPAHFAAFAESHYQTLPHDLLNTVQVLQMPGDVNNNPGDPSTLWLWQWNLDTQACSDATLYPFTWH